MPEPAIPQSTFGETICTLYDGDYHYGLGALANSLIKGGYQGTLWAGHRGPLPFWTSQLRRLDAPGDEFLVGGKIRLVFHQVNPDVHLALYKPQYMKRLLENEARDASYIWFFDSDMYLRSGWGFFQNWQRRGIAAVQDINYRTLPELDPLRQQWMDVGAEMGFGKPRPLNIYFNSGLSGVPASSASYLDMWQSLIVKAGEMGMDLKRISSQSRDLPFHIPDQDGMNVAFMFTPHPVSPAGPEVMGFYPGRTHLYHNVGTKPWRGSILMRALKGTPPGLPSKFYFTVVESPIRLYTPFQLRLKRLAVGISAFIGRFYRRN
jgi:hypothetical protein